ncbi:MAG: hypothetical protein KDG50_05860, partial [Chromatiales bacterium]|nr:hypothetical protein [Chromatiales bacterium]
MVRLVTESGPIAAIARADPAVHGGLIRASVVETRNGFGFPAAQGGAAISAGVLASRNARRRKTTL